MNPMLLFVGLVVLIFGGAVVALYREAARAGGFKVWLMDLPTTNFRIFISILLAILYVVSSLLLTILHATLPDTVRELPDVVLDTVGLFLIGMMGMDVTAYIAKRITHREGPGGGDTPPGATTQMPVTGL